MEGVLRIQNLRNISEEFFAKSLACTKVSDVKTFFDLAQQANTSADILEESLKIESCWTYLHFIEYFGYSTGYCDYVEFCIRNRFAPVSETDLNLALSYSSTAAQSAALISSTAVQ